MTPEVKQSTPDNQPEWDADLPDATDQILDRIHEMKQAGIVFHSAEEFEQPATGKQLEQDRGAKGYTMFKSKQQFDGGRWPGR
ncbi:MAG: hypothetical protein HRU82_18760 [Nitrospira sp.]|nr:MAG: hypothetical protein HRU82_18760 [Nitrospira sp.]